MRQIAEQLLPGITQQPAWPTLQTGLILTDDPARQLGLAVARGPLDDAHDQAAILDQRVTANPHSSRTRTDGGAPGTEPLPLLPGIPGHLQQHPTWGLYLAARATHVAELADRVRTRIGHRSQPAWAQNYPTAYRPH